MGCLNAVLGVTFLVLGLAGLICGIVLPDMLRTMTLNALKKMATVTEDEVAEMNTAEPVETESDVIMFSYPNLALAGASNTTKLSYSIVTISLKEKDMTTYNATYDAESKTYSPGSTWTTQLPMTSQDTRWTTETITQPNFLYFTVLGTSRAAFIPGYLSGLRAYAASLSYPANTLIEQALTTDPRVTLSSTEAANFCALFPEGASASAPSMTAMANVTLIINSHSQGASLTSIAYLAAAGFTTAARQKALYEIMNEWAATAMNAQATTILGPVLGVPFITLPAMSVAQTNYLVLPNKTHVDNVTKVRDVLYTCEDDYAKCGTFLSSEGLEKFTGWGHDEIIKGNYAGRQFEPAQHDAPIKTFSLYYYLMKANIQFKRDEDVPTGKVFEIPVNRYIVDETLMRNDASFVEGTRPGTYENWGPNGVFNMGKFLDPPATGAPLFMSKPYFHNGDAWLRTDFAGFPTTTDAKHNSLLEIEPYTGATVNVAMRYQLNLRIEKQWLFGTSFDKLISTDVMYMPMQLIINENGIPEDDAGVLFKNVHGTFALADLLLPLLVSLGVLFIIFGCCCCALHRKGKKHPKGVVPVESTPA